MFVCLSMLTLQQAGNLSRVYPAPHPVVADVGSSLPWIQREEEDVLVI